MTDFTSFEIEDGTKIGARNLDGSVYVLTLDQLDQNNDNTVTAVDDPFYLVLADETQINSESINYDFEGNINDVLNSEGAEIFVNGDYENLRNADGITLQQQKISVNLTGFALDNVGGTSASKEISGEGFLYYLQSGDPLIFDLMVGL